MIKLKVPYDGRRLEKLDTLTVHSINGDVTFKESEFLIEVTPYSLLIEFPEVSNFDEIQISGVLYKVANKVTSYVQETIPSNESLKEFKH